MHKRRLLLTLGSIALLATGCVTPSKPGAPMATDIPEQRSQSDFWMSRPTKAQVIATDFSDLWNACEAELRFRQFKLDRQDQRGGVITTVPLVSRQFFELWRSDIVKTDDLARSSLSTIRRTVRFDIIKTDDGTYIARPRVLVEQMSEQERQVTSAGEFRETITGRRVEGTRESDRGVNLPAEYWYAIGRDDALEESLAQAINRQIARQ